MSLTKLISNSDQPKIFCGNFIFLTLTFYTQQTLFRPTQNTIKWIEKRWKSFSPFFSKKGEKKFLSEKRHNKLHITQQLYAQLKRNILINVRENFVHQGTDNV